MPTTGKEVIFKDPITGEVLIPKMPDATYIKNTEKGANNGVATLDNVGKIPSNQLPSMNYIPTSQKGAASGVASLGSDGKVPSSQLPAISSSNIYSATLTTSGWVTGSDGRYYQNVSVSGVTSTTKIVIVDVDLTTNDTAAKANYLEAWAGPAANEAVQGNGTITFYTYEKPVINIPIFVGVN